MSHDRMNVSVTNGGPEYDGKKFLGDDVFGLYRLDTMKYSRIEAEETDGLVDEIQTGLAAKAVLDEADAIIKNEKKDLEVKVERGIDARNALVVANTGLVFKWAEHYNNGRVEKTDLIQEGNIGLIRAAESYRSGRASFSTYATKGIVNAVSTAVHEQGRTVALPTHQSIALQKMRRVEQEYQETHGRQIPLDELLEKMNEGRKKKYSIDQVKSLQLCEITPMSLNETVVGPDGEEVELQNAFTSANQISVEDEAISNIEGTAAREMIDEMLAVSHLSDVEKDVVMMYFGENQPFETIVEYLEKAHNKKTSSARVSRMANEALKRLKDAIDS